MKELLIIHHCLITEQERTEEGNPVHVHIHVHIHVHVHVHIHIHVHVHVYIYVHVHVHCVTFCGVLVHSNDNLFKLDLIILHSNFLIF